MSSRSPRRAVRSESPSNASSTSTSPERGADDDNDSFMLQANDSTSSLAPSISQEMTDSEAARLMAERQRMSPISRLPAELMIQIFSQLSGSPTELKSCMLVSKDWARNSVALLWHRPQTNRWPGVLSVARSVQKKTAGYFDYASLVRRLNLSNLAAEVSDGTLQPLRDCKRIERLTLTNCVAVTDASLKQLIEGNRSLLALDITGLDKVTDATMHVVADNCVRLQGLNVTNCKKLTDDSLVAVARNCRHVKRLKFNGCSQLTEKSISVFAHNCKQILEIDLHGCGLLEDDAVTALIAEGRHLRELRLAHCSRITDQAFLRLPTEATYESLRILDLTDCGELNDAGVAKIISAAPRLRNIVFAKCRNLTDRAVSSITKLGKNLHYIHMGHCARITDAGVEKLVKLCNRIRYIDLACCVLLTDVSVQQLATLPKLKRIGLVKCGNITDRSILHLATKSRQVPPVGPSSLERVHLSYCTNLTLTGIHALLNACPRLTHLSLTGVQAFLREDLLVFCREAPVEFNDHQRDVFCVFSGVGVGRLRTYLNTDQSLPGAIGFDTAETMYEDNLDEDGYGGDDVDGDADDEEHDAIALGLTAPAFGGNIPAAFLGVGMTPAGPQHQHIHPHPHAPDMIINVGGPDTPSPLSTATASQNPTPQPAPFNHHHQQQGFAPPPPPAPSHPDQVNGNAPNWPHAMDTTNGDVNSSSPLASPPLLIQSNQHHFPTLHTHNSDPSWQQQQALQQSSAQQPGGARDVTELMGAVAMEDAEMTDAAPPTPQTAAREQSEHRASMFSRWMARNNGAGGSGSASGGAGFGAGGSAFGGASSAPR